MKRMLRYGVSILAFFASVAYAASPTIPSVGKYSFTQEGDELIDGSKASITWNISIKDSNSAVVKISSWHASFTCEGKYAISKKGEQLALSWSSKENPDVECDTPAPQFLLKQSPSGGILIHSDLFPWDSDGWKNMRVIK